MLFIPCSLLLSLDSCKELFARLLFAVLGRPFSCGSLQCRGAQEGAQRKMRALNTLNLPLGALKKDQHIQWRQGVNVGGKNVSVFFYWAASNG